MSYYITQQKKEELEAKIAELEEENKFPIDKWEEGKNQGKIYILEEILSEAIVLPVEESWSRAKLYSHSTPVSISKDYPNGVIIKK